MRTLKSWWALITREYLEHRIAFFYFPLGILGLFAISAVSSLTFNRFRFAGDYHLGSTLKIFELGYLILIALWLAYTAVALFFYYGDAFSADRRNNAMYFWKSMPVSDIKVLASKFLAGVTLFPALIFVMAAVSGLLFFVVLNIASFTFPILGAVDPVATLLSFVHITAFGIVFLAVALLWYAPFLAWVGGLSTIFGRWSLPLAFVIPGVLAAMENMIGFAYIPRGGYIWGYLARRLQFGLSDFDLGLLVASPAQFDVRTYVWLLFRETDWLSVGTGLVFTALVMWLASEYRRRRIA
jgi:ABC-2 type transport system permease protein